MKNLIGNAKTVVRAAQGAADAEGICGMIAAAIADSKGVVFRCIGPNGDLRDRARQLAIRAVRSGDTRTGGVIVRVGGATVGGIGIVAGSSETSHKIALRTRAFFQGRIANPSEPMRRQNEIALEKDPLHPPHPGGEQYFTTRAGA